LQLIFQLLPNKRNSSQWAATFFSFQSEKLCRKFAFLKPRIIWLPSNHLLIVLSPTQIRALAEAAAINEAYTVLKAAAEDADTVPLGAEVRPARLGAGSGGLRYSAACIQTHVLSRNGWALATEWNAVSIMSDRPNGQIIAKSPLNLFWNQANQASVVFVFSFFTKHLEKYCLLILSFIHTPFPYMPLWSDHPTTAAPLLRRRSGTAEKELEREIQRIADTLRDDRTANWKDRIGALHRIVALVAGGAAEQVCSGLCVSVCICKSEWTVSWVCMNCPTYHLHVCVGSDACIEPQYSSDYLASVGSYRTVPFEYLLPPIIP
jgi:hypothetical protein